MSIRREMKKMASHEIYRKEKGKSFLYGMYTFMSEMPIIKRYFWQLKSRLKLLYTNDIYSVNRMTVQIILKGFFTIIPCILAVIVFFEGELFYIIAVLFTINIIFINSINTSVQKLEYRLLNEFADFVLGI